MRHYDVYSLLQRPDVQQFVGTPAYLAHKAKRFRTADNPVIADNPAFRLADPRVRGTYATAYAETSSLYYRTKPDFEQILGEIRRWAGRLQPCRAATAVAMDPGALKRKQVFVDKRLVAL